MKLIISGVTADAAPTRSPSFSRSSSSATMTSLPLRMSSIASCTRSNGMDPSSLQILDDKLANHIAFEVYQCAGGQLRKIGVFPGMRNDGHLNDVGLRQRIHSEAHAVNCNRAVQHGYIRDVLWRFDVDQNVLAFMLQAPHSSYPVHMALDQMPAQAATECKRALQVHGLVGSQ